MGDASGNMQLGPLWVPRHDTRNVKGSVSDPAPLMSGAPLVQRSHRLQAGAVFVFKASFARDRWCESRFKRLDQNRTKKEQFEPDVKEKIQHSPLGLALRAFSPVLETRLYRNSCSNYGPLAGLPCFWRYLRLTFYSSIFYGPVTWRRPALQ